MVPESFFFRMYRLWFSLLQPENGQYSRRHQKLKTNIKQLSGDNYVLHIDRLPKETAPPRRCSPSFDGGAVHARTPTNAEPFEIHAAKRLSTSALEQCSRGSHAGEIDACSDISSRATKLKTDRLKVDETPACHRHEITLGSEGRRGIESKLEALEGLRRPMR